MSEAPAVPTTGASDLPRGQGSCLRTGEVAVPTMLRGQKGSVSPQEACPKIAICDFDASVGGKSSIAGSGTLIWQMLCGYQISLLVSPDIEALALPSVGPFSFDP